MMNGNSAYHVDPNGTDVTGVTFPVKVSDLSLLKDQKQVTDSDSVTITVTNRGQTSSNTYTGKDSLWRKMPRTWRDDSAAETLPFTPTGEGGLYAPTEQSPKRSEK